MRIVPLIAVVVALSAPCGAAVLIPVPAVPGSTETDVHGINDSNVIVGDYFTADGVEHGFYGTLDGTYTTFDYASGIEPRGINNEGLITALSYQADGPPIELERLANGTILNITKDGQQIYGVVQGISNKHGFFAGDIRGSGDGTIDGYIGRNGRYKASVVLPFSVPQTSPRAVNKAGTTAGWYVDSTGPVYGFIAAPGALTVLSYPDAATVETYITSMNDKGLAAGSWDAGSVNVTHAFVFDMRRDRFTPLDVPGATTSGAAGVNNAGLVAIASDAGQFIYCPKPAEQCPAGGMQLRDAPSIPAAVRQFAGFRMVGRPSSGKRALPAIARPRRMF